MNEKKNNFDVVPSTLVDFQAILDNDKIMNTNYLNEGLAGADNYYIPNSIFSSLTSPYNSIYIWSSDIWQGLDPQDWKNAYSRIEYSNVVIDGISSISIDSSNIKSYNNLKGSALFYRAFDFYNIASIFCKPYTLGIASTDLGIPIRLTSDVNVKTIRVSVEQTYDQIISDLKIAASLLPEKPLVKSRPSSVSANALLAKVYLSMEDYSNAAIYADLVLTSVSSLIDFNSSSIVDPNNFPVFPSDPKDNPEILFYASGNFLTINPYASRSRTDTLLLNLYDSNDLRRTIFFYDNGDGTFSFQGTYDGYNYKLFSGIATDEIYLIRAESNARMGNVKAAIADLNLLLTNRYVSGTYTPLITNNSDSVISAILIERRKELPYSGNCRWEDLRRLNKDPKYSKTLVRVINGLTYTLPANDPRYVYPIPDAEIQLSGIQQNPR